MHKISDYLSYPVRFVADPETGSTEAQIRDFSGSTCGDTPEDARGMALDWITLAVRAWPADHKIIPAASAPQEGEELVEIPPTLALKIILRNCMTERNIRPADLGRLIGFTSQAVNSLLDPYKLRTDFNALYRALKACKAEVIVENSKTI